MDNDIANAKRDNVKADPAVQASPVLPKSAPFSANLPTSSVNEGAPGAAQTDAAERNSVFANLVTSDGDIAGLVAYSIYKQHKLDWLTSFEKVRSRPPNDEELASYIIGEGTPRRLATYRHLAEATLAGAGPDVAGTAGKNGLALGRRVGPADRTALTTGLLATYALVAVLFLVAFLLAAHYTMSSR